MADDLHKLLIFLKRKPGMGVEEFRAYYEQKHVPLIMPYMAGPLRYRRSYLEPVEGTAEPEFDVVTELSFVERKMRDMVQAGMMADQLPAEVIEDEMRFLDRSRSRVYAVTEHETPLEAARS